MSVCTADAKSSEASGHIANARCLGRGTVLKYLLISIVIVPVLLGIKTATGRNGTRGLRDLLVGWVIYSLLWVGLLYLLSRRWVG